MKRNKIDYGIDLGTTNSAISRMDSGEATIIKSLDRQKDTTPSCVAFNKKGNAIVGDGGYSLYESDSLSALSKGRVGNSFSEFKRTMGSNKTYSCPYGKSDYSSDALSAEVLKELKKYVNNEQINAAVITIPAAYTNNQIDAVRRAAKLAGLQQIEALQEPVAAAMCYGVDNKDKDGYWLVFDFGGGTFDAALIKVEEGIIKVIDTEGDNHLGGKNLDLAIVDQIIIPQIQKDFEVDELIENGAFRGAFKFYAETIKNNLSFNETYNLFVDEGDCGEDDNGEEIEIDLDVTKSSLKKAIGPLFQSAIDLSLALLKRNNLTGEMLTSLILVGGPTLSPILREMLSEQICTPDTSADPMTVVSKGAALYASTIDLNAEITDQQRDRTKIQLAIDYEATTVELEEFVPFKILADKTDGDIPSQVFVQVKRKDGAFTSDKVEINTSGEIVDVLLNEYATNQFDVLLFDCQGNQLDCEPSHFNILQGSQVGSSILPYHYGIEVKKEETGKNVFSTIPGLEKNKTLPATGLYDELVTQKQILPGSVEDFIKIPLYLGNISAEGTRASYNEHIYDIIISGKDLPALLPEASTVELTLTVDSSQQVKAQVYFPCLDHTSEIDVPTNTIQSISTDWLVSEFNNASSMLSELDINEPQAREAASHLAKAKETFNTSKDDVDTKKQALAKLRESLKMIDALNEGDEWSKVEKKLNYELHHLKTSVEKNTVSNENKQVVAEFSVRVAQVKELKDINIANKLIDDMGGLYVDMNRLPILQYWIQDYANNFESLHWSDSVRARSLIDEGLNLIATNPTVDKLQPIFSSLYRMLPRKEKPTVDNSLLIA